MVMLRALVALPALLASLVAAGGFPAPGPEITSAPAAPRLGKRELEKRDYRTLYGDPNFVGYFTSNSYATTWDYMTCASGGYYTETYTSGHYWAGCWLIDYVDFVTSCYGDYAYGFYVSTYFGSTYTGYNSASCYYSCISDIMMYSLGGSSSYFAGCAPYARSAYTVFHTSYDSLPAIAGAVTTTPTYTTTSRSFTTTPSQTSTPTSSRSSTPTPNPNPIGKKKKTPLGPIIGGVVGGLAFIGVAITTAFVAWRKKRAAANHAAGGHLPHSQPVLVGGGGPDGAPPGQPVGVAAGGYYQGPEKTAAATTSPVQSPPPVYAAPNNGGWGQPNMQPQYGNMQPQYGVAPPPDGIHEVGGGQQHQQAPPVQGGWAPPQPVGSPVPQPRPQAHEIGS